MSAKPKKMGKVKIYVQALTVPRRLEFYFLGETEQKVSRGHLSPDDRIL